MPQFDITYLSSQFFWLTLVFAALYLAVSRLIIPKAEAILTSRSRIINDNIDKAQEYADFSEKLTLEKDALIKQAMLAAEHERILALEAIEQEMAQRRLEIEASIKEKSTLAQRELDLQIQKFQKNTTASQIKLATVIIEKISGTKVDSKLLEKIVAKE